LGRDVLSRLIYGAQRTVTIALLGTGTALILGLVLAITEVWGGWWSRLADVVLDVALAFPSLLLALVLVTLLGQGSWQVALASGLGQFAPFAVFVRGLVRVTLISEYVLASKSMGASKVHLVCYHVWRATWAQAVSYAGMTFVYVLMNSSTLGFLGLGGDPSLPEWGAMLADGRLSLRSAPWVTLAPAIALGLLVYSALALTDGLSRDERANRLPLQGVEKRVRR
jgi:ABC-type dipeptide/oligopeptide/nickel transport system permease subunit